MRRSDLTEHAQHNRMAMTPAERELWASLRRLQTGQKFRRQQQILHYIVDFYCAERRVAVEVDGESHADLEAYDAKRDADLMRRHIVTLRFTNEQIFSSVDRVVEEIHRACVARPIYRPRGSVTP